MLAGYRLIRLIGRGEHAEAYLAHPVRRGDDGGDPVVVAVKIVPASDRSRGDAEVLALQAVVSDHVVRLIDVATLADGSLCIVETPGARGTAAALVGRRGSLSPGECVTLVVSILRGLGDLHEAGLSHGALDLTHVLIDASGRPQLGGLGSSRALDGTGAPADVPVDRGRDPVGHDLSRVARIARALREPEDARSRLSEPSWDDWLASLDEAVHGDSPLSAHDLADRLLAVADAAPLADAGPRADVVPAADLAGRPDRDRRDVEVSRAAPDVPLRSRVRPRRDRTVARRHLAPRDPPARRLDARVRILRTVLRRELAAVRPRAWVLGAGVLLLTAVGTVAVPLLTDPAHGTDGGAGPPAATSPATTPAGLPDVPAPAVADGHPAEEEVAAAAATVATSDDPVVAAPAILRLRAACLRDRDASCLAGVDQPGSAMEDADRQRVRADDTDALDDSSLHVGDDPGSSQRMGDTALVPLSPVGGADESTPGRRPASLLMVRGEAGWRIRDLMDDR